MRPRGRSTCMEAGTRERAASHRLWNMGARPGSTAPRDGLSLRLRDDCYAEAHCSARVSRAQMAEESPRPGDFPSRRPVSFSDVPARTRALQPSHELRLGEPACLDVVNSEDRDLRGFPGPGKYASRPTGWSLLRIPDDEGITRETQEG